ncbi:hypothetical protein SAMN05428954_5680 [Streptomyces sp. 2112.3]|nr:hypothetical protein BX261_1602 [Streptomyces sp. 2321.6]SDR53452.1 hypothetical protein SAMN05216511_5616 [Streptomyces sp. KS_16]SEC27687.1 hypothetical protein SAMN05428940_1602 [Streptomyces sp. 2133.1]SEF05616.1 hypothetical protein SAMN05428954_5680 [Streptomyces sp. 2112.3]SNC66303.1 hypothetical protein SAMN06272741_1598 [Streptomyces sp. 2114.4]
MSGVVTMASQTTAQTNTVQEKPVDLPLTLEPGPKPIPGCAHCDKVAIDRDRAKANGDGSSVSDCNVRMRRHLSDAH